MQKHLTWSVLLFVLLRVKKKNQNTATGAHTNNSSTREVEAGEFCSQLWVYNETSVVTFLQWKFSDIQAPSLGQVCVRPHIPGLCYKETQGFLDFWTEEHITTAHKYNKGLSTENKRKFFCYGGNFHNSLINSLPSIYWTLASPTVLNCK